MNSADDDILDFDSINDWGPRLNKQLAHAVPENIAEIIAEQRPEYVEDARDALFASGDRQEIVAALTRWIESRSVYGYHGSRLMPDDLASIRREGLKPLVASQREDRIRRSLSAHPRWHLVEPQLKETLNLYGPKMQGGHREGLVHLTISKMGLIESFNHYLTEGSEFDGHVAHHLLGAEGHALISQDGEAALIQIQVPGATALAACNPWGPFGNELPNLISDILKAWSYWLAYPEFNSGSL